MKKFSVLAALVTVFAFTSCSKTKVEINGIADLEGKKIGVQSGTTGEAWVQDNVKNVKLSSFKTGIDAALDLKTGAIDAVVLDELPASAIVSKNPDLKIVRDQVFTDNKEEYAIAVKKGNAELLNSINKTINDLKSNGGYEQLVQSFMPVDGKISIPAVDAVQSSKIVKLGTNATFPPFEYVEGKDVVGFDITMGQYIANTYNANLQVVDMAFDSLIPALSSGAIDFIAAGMSVTEERKKNVDFSVPYFASEQVIIVRK
ncbi:transporter substrate-binding domain-containing protein [Treponema sp.]|uniref:transporter substrate-binding domain-containing protein n=1 Tax=Treponema sp. TaxID=166 RepID=UPI00298E2335|nr:transporter substrate-binding domain-containing protein [Treponema sp.]MCR5612726.1 transporter substrate-binding domain-containing protein [Treponema sp.]